jgi:adenosylcobalamin-dependent ribonucleoside-triphosphate reductase
VVRGKGTPIKGFGGVASGPEDLVLGINKISEVLMKCRGKKLRPIHALDIMCIIGEIIVAGNVRRSALLAIGDPDDIEFLLAKRWDMGTLPSYRAMSNNSVACDDISDLHEYFWQSFEGKGESIGLINLPLTRRVGRLGETKYPDPLVTGYNPCCEQGLEPDETCCLGTIFLPNVESKEEFLDILELVYRVCKHSLMLPSHHPDTAQVVRKNMRMGISICGDKQANDEQLSWLSDGYEYLREFDEEYSFANGMPTSIKLTTVQPSGTLSLLPGITPGAHPGFARFMYRRIRIASSHELVTLCKNSGYPTEYARRYDGTEDYNTTVITFPFSYPEGTKLAKDMSAIDQLNGIKFLQKNWSDNSVSCTVYFKPEELPQIKKYLELNYASCHKSLSFMLQKDHGFDQAPFEEITEEEYNALVKATKPIGELNENIELSYDDECAGGACPIR